MKERGGIKRTEKADSEGFRRWYITPRITQFLDSVHRPIFLNLENATFRKLGLCRPQVKGEEHYWVY
jgi:hypothetical protein